MFRDEYVLLIQTLIQATKAGFLNWSKGQNLLAYTAHPPPGQIIQVDKYYAIEDELSNTCINFTLFTSDHLVIDEIVFCRGDDDSPVFDLLNELYKEVELQYARNTNPNLPIVLAAITQSLTDQLKTRPRP